MNSQEANKVLISAELKKFLKEHSDVKFRYSYSPEDELHLIEVSPSFMSFLPIMDDLDKRLTDLVASNDMSQSVVIFPEGDLDFHFDRCEFEIQGPLFSSNDWDLSSFYEFGSFRSPMNLPGEFVGSKMQFPDLVLESIYEAKCTDKTSGFCELDDNSYALAA
jgi:hypothetical protein